MTTKDEETDSGKALVNPADPIEMQRIQETKPARTSTGPGETSVPKSETSDKEPAANKDATESGDQSIDRV